MEINKYNNIKAICILHQNDNNINGYIKFYQLNNKVKIEYKIMGMSDGYHGIHIHDFGDLSDKCNSTCNHFNPFNKNHGGPDSKERHVGDLGNLYSENRISEGYFFDDLISLNPKDITSIIGRAVVIHQYRDDLGLGKNKESLKTGNAGKRIACGVIGIK